MKNLSIIVGMYLLTAIVVPSLLQAQYSSQGIQYENAATLNQVTPDSPELQVPELSLGHAVERLTGTEGTEAGAPDTKSLTTPSTPPPDQMGEFFSSPSAYAEYKYAHIQDNRSIGFDGPQENGIAGFDFQSFYDTILGFNFTYTNNDLTTVLDPVHFSSLSDAYFFSSYAAKNFFDWVNVGGSVTYGRTDTTFRAETTGGSVGQRTSQDTVALSPFIGAAHTWGAFSFSSTATYIWGYDHFDFDVPDVNDTPSAATAPGDAKTLNQTFSVLNNVQYAITKDWSVSVQGNYTRLITTQSVPTTISPLVPPLGHQWATFGVRSDYSFNKDGSVFVSFEHDDFNIHFSDYRIRTGISYNF